MSIPRLVKAKNLLVHKSYIEDLPVGIRGIYVLYKHVRRTGAFNVVYVGMSAKGRVKARLMKHEKSEKQWTHFSVFQVWENISDEEIAELEGLFRVIYREDSSANKFNKQQSYGPYRKLPQVFEE